MNCNNDQLVRLTKFEDLINIKEELGLEISKIIFGKFI